MAKISELAILASVAANCPMVRLAARMYQEERDRRCREALELQAMRARGLRSLQEYIDKLGEKKVTFASSDGAANPLLEQSALLPSKPREAGGGNENGY